MSQNLPRVIWPLVKDLLPLRPYDTWNKLDRPTIFYAIYLGICLSSNCEPVYNYYLFITHSSMGSLTASPLLFPTLGVLEYK